LQEKKTQHKGAPNIELPEVFRRQQICPGLFWTPHDADLMVVRGLQRTENNKKQCNITPSRVYITTEK